MALDTGAWGEATTNAAGEEPIEDPQTGRVIGKHAKHESSTFSYEGGVWVQSQRAFEI